MKSLLFSLSVFFTSIGLVEAQYGNVHITEEPEITSMMIRMVDINRSKEGIEGWRVQILATTDRRKMEAARTNFLSKYPNHKINWVHEKPYYKLRVGAFVTKLEAMRLLHKLKRYYPSAYPAKDHHIHPGELVGL